MSSLWNTRCPFHSFVAGGLLVGIGFALSTWTNRIRRNQSLERFDVSSRFTELIKYGDLVFMSGQLGEGETIEEQTRNALSIIDSLLEKAGTNKNNIVELTIWLQDIERDYNGMNKVYDDWLPKDGPPPPRACIEAKLFSKKYFVEIRAVAVIPK